MKSIIFVLVLVTVSSGSLTHWEKFKSDHNKQYESIAEETKRQQIFFENLNKIREYERNNPNATFKLGVNPLADRTIEELVMNKKIHTKYYQKQSRDVDVLVNVPDSFDWRAKGVVTPVYNQGMIGSITAIVSVEVVESLHAIQTGQLERGSIARVADCCPQTVDVFECIAKMGGICRAADYPTPTGQCKPDACKPFTGFTKIMRLTTKNEDTMVLWIQNSTLAVGIDASRSSFQFYQNGIYAEKSCSSTVIDHMMQLVGYGKTSTGDLFWICKNSWGTSWGENGYMRVLRGANTCGIATYVTQVA